MKEKAFRTFCANFVIIVVLALSFSIAFVATYDVDTPIQVSNNAIYMGNDENLSVSLMFNVYQNGDIALEIARLLTGRGHNATFFIGGSWAAKNPNTLLNIATLGCEIGNHGYLHRDHATLNLNQNVDEIVVTERLINSVLSSLPSYQNSRLFAPPSGSIGTNMFDACDKLNYKVIMWSADTIDWRDQDTELIFTRATKDIKAGSLILMHPTPATLEALPRILDYIESIGLKADVVSNVI